MNGMILDRMRDTEIDDLEHPADEDEVGGLEVGVDDLMVVNNLDAF
jgi:hypothetical protein